MSAHKISSGHIVLVDDIDDAMFDGDSWCLSQKGRSIYVARSFYSRGEKREPLLHRLIVAASLGQIVDHINGDTLDNRRANLRIVDATQNARNRRKTAKETSSRFKGVCFDRRHKSRPWRATIRVDGGRKHLGQFAAELDAARAYDVASRQFHGEFGRTNFP